jgi:hypothetical protein
MMPNSHDITALTHRVRDIFNKVWGQWSVACEMSALRIENAYYLLALITAQDESYVIFLTGKLFQNILFNCEFETKIVLSHQINNVQWG